MATRKTAVLPPHLATLSPELLEILDRVRRIALSFPEVEEGRDRFGFAVPNKGKLKGFAWVWLERVHPKKGRVPNHRVLAIRVANLGQKAAILASDPAKFFTEPHYNGYPAVLARLEAVTTSDLELLLEDGWRSQAPKALVAAYASRATPAIPTKKGAAPRARARDGARRPARRTP